MSKRSRLPSGEERGSVRLSHFQPISILKVPRLLAAVAFFSAAISTVANARPSLSIAAASNFVYAVDALNAEFARVVAGVALTTSTGASGTLFAQITNGAPFDVFLSADTDYPGQIVAAGRGSASTVKIFATGRLVIWTTSRDVDLSDPANAIRATAVRKIAIAQPKSAPYGRAARAALENLGVWRDAASKIVMGENITQTAQFVETGNAEIGLVAKSLVLSPRLANKGRWMEIDPKLYSGVSLDHAAVLTTRGAANPMAARYLEFLLSEPARKILRDFGYGVP
jgi:molybdate transport system substrate-binding protein